MSSKFAHSKILNCTTAICKCTALPLQKPATGKNNDILRRAKKGKEKNK